MNPGTPNRGTLLFADDDRAAREGLGELLRRRGFACITVESGEQALLQLGRAGFDALIADIHMPGNAGLELIEAVSRVAAGLPVVLLTGRPTVETAARSVRLAATAYLTKPPPVDELCAILDPAIATYRGFRSLQAGRARLRAWEGELAEIEQRLRAAPAAPGPGPLGSYLRLSLRQVMLLLADLERASQELERPGAGNDTMLHVEQAAALRHAVEVLERTKQNFKSKDLADLRRRLEELLQRSDSLPPPASSSA